MREVEFKFRIFRSIYEAILVLILIFIFGFLSTYMLIRISNWKSIADFIIFTVSSFLFISYYFTPTIIANNINRSDTIGPFSFLFNILKKVFYFLVTYTIFLLLMLFRSFFKKNEPFSMKELNKIYEDAVNIDSRFDSLYEITGTTGQIRHPKILPIFLINLFLGGTLVFWLVAYFWACAPGTVKISGSKVEDNRDIKNDFNNKNTIAKNLNNHNIENRIKELNEIYKKGLINDDEYNKKKQDLLNEL